MHSTYYPCTNPLCRNRFEVVVVAAIHWGSPDTGGGALKRTTKVLAIAVLVTALILAMAAPAFAVASSKANCAGKDASTDATTDGRDFGQANAQNGQNWQGIGQELSPLISSNCGAR